MFEKITIFVFLILIFASANLTHNVFAQTVKADYRFQNTRNSTVAGAPDLTDFPTVGANTFVTSTVDGQPRTVLQFPEGNGLRLAPTSGVIANGVYTIVILFEFDTVRGYRKVLDFKNGTSDSGLYVFNDFLSFFPGVIGTATLTPNVYYQVVLTRDAAGTVTGYIDGVQQFSFSDTSQLAEIDSNNALRFFRDDNVQGTESSGGSVARIRLYDAALTAAQVAALDRIAAPPTAASVTVRGRILVGKRRGLSNARVTMVDTNGEARTILTNPFGYYRFEDVSRTNLYFHCRFKTLSICAASGHGDGRVE
jgi:hypothetical protein